MLKLNRNGFTLVELMIVVALSGVVLSAIYSLFQTQQRSYIIQEDVSEMQQEIRSAMEIMSRELRNAGHDPQKTSGAGFLAASPYSVQFSMDLTDDGSTSGPNEVVEYELSDSSNGIANVGAADLGRDTGGGLQDLSGNIQAIGFAFAYDINNDGKVEMKSVSGTDRIIWAVPSTGGIWIDLDTNGDGNIDNNDATPLGMGEASATQNSTMRQEIRAVKIWILARTSRSFSKYSDTNSYKVGANRIPAPNDNFRRRLLSVNVKCRNMGLGL